MSSRTIKAAAVQAEPVWCDLQATIGKACDLISKAASEDVQIIAFPELWIPGYPAWIWVPGRAMDFDMCIKYTQNALRLDSEEMEQLKQCAATHGIVVCMGYCERRGATLYVGQCTIDSDGQLLAARRKLKPFHLERTVFGDGDGLSLNNVASTAVGKVGLLSCGEHFNPLLTFNTLAQGEEIHVAAWPPVDPHPGGPAPYSMSSEGVAALSRAYSMQAQCFTLHCTAVITSSAIDAMGTRTAPVFQSPGGGCAKIFGPDGRQLSDDLPATQEGFVTADLDMTMILKEKAILDTSGHMSRPDLLWLGRAAHQRDNLRTERERE